MELRGTLPALVTPFRDGAVDHEGLRALVERLLEGGVDGLVPCGTTGESVTLEPEEHRAVIQTVVEQARGRAPVIAGVGTVSTRRTIELARDARDLGADALLVVCPYYDRPTQAGLEAHFRAVADAVSLPTMLYNVPARTGVDLALETLARLADVPSIVAIKEATGTVGRSQRILARLGDRFLVFAGDDALTLPVLAVGGVGVVSVTANAFPKETSEVVRAFEAGDLERARAQHLRLLPVHDAMFVESNPGPIKALLGELGHMSGEMRLPLVAPSAASVATILEAARRAELVR